MSTIVLRQANLVDLDLVVSLFDEYRQFYGSPSDVAGARAFLRNHFEHGESVIFLALVDGKAMGFTQLYPSFSSIAMARIFILNDLFVRAEGRRMGLGRSLLHTAADYACSLQARRLCLSTSVKNLQAQALYESEGWQRDQQYFHYELELTQV